MFNNRPNTNLFDETVKILEDNGIDMSKGKSTWVWGVMAESFGRFTWDEFAEIAKETWYYAGYGGAQIAPDLIVYGEDFWLERHEYDGSEWWEFKSQPNPDELERKVPQRLGSTGWVSDLASANDEEEWEDWMELPKSPKNQGI